MQGCGQAILLRALRKLHFRGRHDPRIDGFSECRNPDRPRHPAVVPQGPPKRRLARYVPRQTPALRIKSFQQADFRAFRFLRRGFEIKVLLQDFATAAMDYAGGSANLFIRTGRHILLQKIHQTPFSLQRAEQLQPGRMHPLRGRFDRRCFQRPDRLGDSPREFPTKPQPETQLQPLPNRNAVGPIVLFHPGTIL